MIRPWLGIRIESLAENEALRERVTGIDRGVVVDTIEADAPAYKSDLRPADIIMEVDGVKLATAHDLQKEVLKKKVGQTIQLTVWRNGSYMIIPVITGELPVEFGRVAGPVTKRLIHQCEGGDLRAQAPRWKDRRARRRGAARQPGAAGGDLRG